MSSFVVSADFTYRHFIHLPFVVDLNHLNGAHGPSIPACRPAQRSDPTAFCSNGTINVAENEGLATYKGLLVRADKRFSHGFQLLGSWARSRNTGTDSGSGFDLTNWLANRGPLDTDYPTILNLAGVSRLPGQCELG